MRLQLQEQIKYVHNDVADVKVSSNGGWMEIEALEKEVLVKTKQSLQASLEAEKKQRLLLDSYSRRGKVRLVRIAENEDEDTET